MNSIIAWAVSITAAAAVCIIAELVSVNSSVKKLLRFTLGAFLLCAMLMPIKNFTADFKLSNFYQQQEIPSEVFKTSENADKAVSGIAEASLRTMIEEKISDEGAKAQKIEIFFKEDENKSISAAVCTIYIDKQYSDKRLQIKRSIKESLDIEADVKIVGQR